MIHHRTARRIASEWHGGIASDLYLLTSTGTISTDAEREIIDARREVYEQSNHGIASAIHDLNKLLAYVRHYGPRGPVDGWSKLSW